MRNSIRKSNIELLRILSMLMIVAHHIAVHSHFAFSNEVITANKLWIQFISAGGKVGVNVFVLISGYFLVSAASIKYNKVIKLWLQIFSYSAVIFLLATTVFGELFSLKATVKNFLPITFSNWWFASTYFVFYLLSPYIGRFLNTIDKKTYQRFLLLLGFCWCIIPTFLTQNWESNSLLWFVFLYALAGYIRLHLNTDKINAGFCFLSVLIVMTLTYLSTIAFDLVGTKISLFASNATYFYDMQKLPTLLISVFLFIGFLKLDISCKPFINVIASASFGVYLIHDNDYIREFLWVTLFKNQTYSDSSFLVPYTVFQIFFVFSICTAIELFRIYCIEKLYLKPIDSVLRFIKKCTQKLSSSKLAQKLLKRV